MKRLVIGIVCAALAASVALAEPATPPAGQPAAGTPPVSSGNPPVRYNWKANHDKALAALKARDYKTAIIIFTEVINSGRLPKTWVAPTYYMRGKAYRSSRQYKLAVEDYNAAVAADPKMDVAYYELGATYQALNQHSDAAQAFGKAIAIKNSDPAALLSLARLQQDRGNVAAARAREALRSLVGANFGPEGRRLSKLGIVVAGDGTVTFDEVALAAALEAADGRKSEAARLLGMNRRTLYRREERHDEGEAGDETGAEVHAIA